MVIKDYVYSTFEITSPIVLEFLETNAFQRLKRINQFGMPDEYYHIEGFSRYDHCLGVYILLNRLGASEEEQVAGLLHDVSHTAFSHVIDWVIGDGLKEDYQDKRHLSVIQQKEIADILKKHNFTPESMANYEQFKLLEKDVPDLCADRVDYSLRESSPEVIQKCLPDLINFSGKIAFKNEKSALIFAENFLEQQMRHWAGYESVTRFGILADILKRALSENVVSMEDFSETDDHVIDKLLNSKNIYYRNRLEILKNKNLDFLPRVKERIRKKFRHADPVVIIDGNEHRLSRLNEHFKEKLEIARKECELGLFPGKVE